MKPCYLLSRSFKIFCWFSLSKFGVRKVVCCTRTAVAFLLPWISQPPTNLPNTILKLWHCTQHLWIVMAMANKKHIRQGSNIQALSLLRYLTTTFSPSTQSCTPSIADNYPWNVSLCQIALCSLYNFINSKKNIVLYHYLPKMSNCSFFYLLAPQSGALRRGAYRDSDRIPSTYSFWAFKPVYTEAFQRSKAFYGDLWESVALLDH